MCNLLLQRQVVVLTCVACIPVHVASAALRLLVLGGRSLSLRLTWRLLHWMVATNDSLTGADRMELVYCIACYLAPVRRIVGWTRSLAPSAHPVHL
jgi:hypothetical protein